MNKFYTNFDEINEAKKLLYEKSNRNFSTRRGDDKSMKTAQDIVEAFVSCDNNGITLPTFAATDYSRIPITSDGAVTMEQVLNVVNMMNVRLGAVENSLSGKTSTPDLRIEVAATPSSPAESTPTETVAGFPVAQQRQQPQHQQQPRHQQQQPRQPQQNRRASFSASSTHLSRPPRERSRSKTRHTFIGKKVSNGELSWGGVELLTHRYIGNVRHDVTAAMIAEDLRRRDVEVVSLVENDVKKHSRYKSFKLSVKRCDSGKIDVEDFWPSNVVVRRWHNPRHSKPGQDGNDGASALSTES